MNKLLFFILLFLFSIGKAHYTMAQDSRIVTNNISTDNGLTDNNIHCILQDSQDFIWFGSEEGLHRYDGYTIEVFRHKSENPNSLAANLVRALYEDKYGRLWIGTDGGGISVYDLKTERFTHINNNSDGNIRLTSDQVFCFSESKDNKLWVGTKNGLNLLTIAPDNNEPVSKITHYYHEPDNPKSLIYPHVYSILEDKNGTLWAGTTEGGLSRLDEGSHSFINYYADEKKGSISSAAIMSILEDRHGDLWFGTWAHGLNLYNRADDSFINFLHNEKDTTTISHDNVYALCQDNDGYLWAGTYDGGLNKLIRGQDISSYKFERYIERKDALKSLFKNKVKVIYPDKQGNLWAGTLGGGVIQIYNKPENFIHITNTLNNYNTTSANYINAVSKSDSTQMLLATNSGLFQLDQKQNYNMAFKALLEDSTQTPNLYKKRIQAIYQTNEGHIWVGTETEGLMRFVFDGEKLVSFKQYSPYKPVPYKINSLNVKNIFEWNNQLWVITKEGVNIFNPKHQRFIFEKKDGTKLFPLDEIFTYTFIDNQNRLWAGTQYEGLFCFSIDDNYQGGQLLHHFNEDTSPIKLADKQILHISEANNDNIWVGTTKGLHLINTKNNTNIVYKEKEGLPSSAVSQIYKDKKNNLWLGTLQGLARFNTQSGVITTYFMPGGFLSNYFIPGQVAEFSNGLIAMPTQDGLWAFFPDQVSTNPYLVKPILRNISLSGKVVETNEPVNKRIILNEALSFTKKIELPHHENVIQIGYAALSFIEQDANSYMYKLEGLEEEWNYSDAEHRSVIYSNLSPNEYTFRLKAANSDGEWNPQEATLLIIINPPYYKTWYAYVTYLLVLIALILLAQRFIIQRVKAKEQLKRESIARDREAVLHQMKMRFFTNISHEFRTPLTLIAGPLQEMLDNDSTLSEPTKNQLKLMKNNSDRLLRLINQLMDFRKVSQGNMHLTVRERNITSFIKRVSESFQGIADQKNINFTYQIDSKPLLVWFDAEKLETIIFNLLSNAFKYTPPNGTISISLETHKGKNITIKVNDNGSGVPDEDKEKIFERFYQSEKNQSIGVAGTGVGLSLVKDLVEMHHGNISVQDNKPNGTTFVISLLVSKDNFSEDEIIEDMSSTQVENIDPSNVNTKIANPVITESGDKPKVLVVEDQKDLRSHLCNILKNHYRVDEATNGIEGLEKASSSLPDIIISDVMMPEMDGFTFCDKLRNNVITSHIPIIMLTALDNADSKQEGLEAGADAYVVKPFNKQLLVTQIQNLLTNRQLLKNRFKEQWDFVEEIATTSTDQQFVNRAIKTVEENMSDANFNVSELVKKMTVSRTLLHMKLRELTGQSTSEFIRTIRLKQAAKLLKQGELNVSEVTYQVGFNDPKYFSKSFKSLFGVTPTNFQKGDASGGELLN